MTTSPKETLEREGFWTFNQAIHQDLRGALEEFNAKVAQQAESLLRGILERGELVVGSEIKEDEIKQRCVRVRRPGPVVADRLFRLQDHGVHHHNVHCLEREIGLEEIGNSTFVDDYMLDGKSVLYVVYGFRGNVFTVRFVVS